MKKTIIQITIAIFFFLAPLEYLYSQDVPPPPPPNHGENGNQENGGGAPVGGGLWILMGLSSAYGAYKAYKLYQKKKKSLLN